MTDAGLSYNVTVQDLEEMIFQEKAYRWESMLQRKGDSWAPDIYHNLEEIRERMDWLVSSYPSLVTKKQLGTTYEGRSIDALVVREAGGSVKPGIWLDCGIHAREWVSPPACLHAVERLVQGTNAVNPRDNLLAVYDFYILPVANPDGYVYSWKSDRMWRKNRRPLSKSQTGAAQGQAPGGWPGAGGWFGQQNPGGFPGFPGGFPGYPSTYNSRQASKCTYGVDPNRNFPALFNKGTDSTCADSYKGNNPFSEAESAAIKKGIDM